MKDGSTRRFTGVTLLARRRNCLRRRPLGLFGRRELIASDLPTLQRALVRRGRLPRGPYELVIVTGSPVPTANPDSGLQLVSDPTTVRSAPTAEVFGPNGADVLALLDRLDESREESLAVSAQAVTDPVGRACVLNTVADREQLEHEVAIAKLAARSARPPLVGRGLDLLMASTVLQTHVPELAEEIASEFLLPRKAGAA